MSLARVVRTVILVAAALAPGCSRKAARPEPPPAVDPGAVVIAAPVPPAPKGPDPIPRRMLFISISKYMYLNPLTYAEVRNGSVGVDKTRAASMRFAYEWRVPGDQLFLLSDSAKSDDAKQPTPMPMRNVVMGAYEQFFATSRAQDRIVVYFGGHALEKDGKAYIAPIEGDLDEPEASLIPLSEFYDKLRACRATQKVVIWDVCRFNPERGKQRPGSEPMTETLYKALAAAPEGTEVVITCQPGENALEFFNLQVDTSGSTATAARFAGSAFLESMRAVSSKKPRDVTGPSPGDPINVTDWAAAVARKVNEVATLPTVGLKQTVKVEGKMPEVQTAPDPKEPAAKRFDMPVPPKGTSPAEIASIVNEFIVPPIRRDPADAIISDIAFRDEVMKLYKPDVSLEEVQKDKEKYKLRVATIAALDKIRKMWATAPGATGGPQIRDSFVAPVNDRLKKDIKDELEFWAIGIAELEPLEAGLDRLAAMRGAEPKRWQAHYDYARAAVKARLAYMREYQRVMGDVLADKLPKLDARLGQDGYKLVSVEKPTEPKAAKLAEEARELFTKIATEHKGTPWAIQARRDRGFALGLAWKAFSSGTE
jgi:hypothetical protein